MQRRTRMWFLLPLVVLWACDVGLTLQGQSASYWSGDYSMADEANPLARPALVHGPGAFLLLALAGVSAASMILLLVPHRLAIWLAVVVTFSHSIGAAAWLSKMGHSGWVASVLFLLLVAEGVAYCWRQAGKPAINTPVQNHPSPESSPR